MTAAAAAPVVALVDCPACEGRGDCACWNCWGFGKVDEGSVNATCVHTFQHHENIGRCLNVHRCTKCGHEATIDSSD